MSAEINVLLSEIEERKNMFSSSSSGLRGPEKNKEWEKVTLAVISVSSVQRVIAEMLKKVV